MTWEELVNECATIARGVAYDPNIKQSELYHEIAREVADRVSRWTIEQAHTAEEGGNDA